MIQQMGVLLSSLLYFSVFPLAWRWCRTPVAAFCLFFLFASCENAFIFSLEYQGWPIAVVFLFLTLLYSFYFLIQWYGVKKNLPIAILVSSHIFFEWILEHVFCGYSLLGWGERVGALAISLGWLQLIGASGLSAVVVVLNLIAVRKSSRVYLIFVISFLVIGLSGYLQKGEILSSKKIAIIEPLYPPHEKMILDRWYKEVFWIDLFDHIAHYPIAGVDITLLPEGAIPGEMEDHINEPFFSRNNHMLKKLRDLIGGVVYAGAIDSNFNSMFYVSEHGIERIYSKRRLVPIGEYIPFSFLAPLVEKTYGIGSFITPAANNRLHSHPFVASICYEECFSSDFFPQVKQANAHINISNDGWFPNTSFAIRHAISSAIRSKEYGITTIRACSHGESGVISPYGSKNFFKTSTSSEGMKIHLLSCDLLKLHTPFSLIGPTAVRLTIILLSLALIFFSLFKKESIFIDVLAQNKSHN